MSSVQFPQVGIKQELGNRKRRRNTCPRIHGHAQNELGREENEPQAWFKPFSTSAGGGNDKYDKDGEAGMPLGSQVPKSRSARNFSLILVCTVRVELYDKPTPGKTQEARILHQEQLYR